MCSSIARRLGEGRLETIAAHLEPGLACMVLPVRRDAIKAVGARTLEALFAGALLEHGATVDMSLGEPGLVFRLHGELVAPGELAARSLEDAATCRILETWAANLEDASGRGSADGDDSDGADGAERSGGRSEWPAEPRRLVARVSKE